MNGITPALREADFVTLTGPNRLSRGHGPHPYSSAWSLRQAAGEVPAQRLKARVNAVTFRIAEPDNVFQRRGGTRSRPQAPTGPRPADRARSRPLLICSCWGKRSPVHAEVLRHLAAAEMRRLAEQRSHHPLDVVFGDLAAAT